MNALQQRLETDESDVSKILKALFLPKLYGDNFRLASEGAGIRSATGNLSQVIDVSTDWAAANTTAQIPASDMIAFLFGNTLRSFVYFYHNSTGASYAYLAQDEAGNTSWDIQPHCDIQPQFVRANSTNAPGNISPHGQILYAGKDFQGNSYLWVDNSPLAGSTANLRVTFTAVPAVNNAISIVWYVWNGKMAVPVYWTRRLASQTFDCDQTTIPVGGAYMFVKVCTMFAGTPVSVPTFSVSVIGNRGCWAHVAIPSMYEYANGDDVPRVNAIRVNAAAVKAQNNSTEIDKNGNLISCTVASGIPWTNFATSVSALSNLQNYRERSNAKGYYGMLLPDTDEDISSFFDDVVPYYNAANYDVQTTFPLTERRPYKAVGISAPVAAGRSFLFDVTHAIEYLTNWEIQAIDNPLYSEDSITAAIIVAATMETDYENPSHWQDIVNTIGRYGERVINMQLDGPLSGVMDAISKFHPAMTLARMLGKNVVLPAQRGLFQEMKNYGNSKRARKQSSYMDM